MEIVVPKLFVEKVWDIHQRSHSLTPLLPYQFWLVLGEKIIQTDIVQHPS